MTNSNSSAMFTPGVIEESGQLWGVK